MPGLPAWNPDAQVATIGCLIAAGADPNAMDKSGVAPLHRAVRARCAAAVEALLDGGVSTGPAVSALQKGLKAFDGPNTPTDPGQIDGNFGQRTEAAVRAYQTR